MMNTALNAFTQGPVARPIQNTALNTVILFDPFDVGPPNTVHLAIMGRKCFMRSGAEI